MSESSDRKELEKRLEQARRIADLALDPLTKERLQRLVQELEEQLRLSK
jgi:TATA-binding protein-associated factor Taf7